MDFVGFFSSPTIVAVATAGTLLALVISALQRVIPHVAGIWLRGSKVLARMRRREILRDAARARKSLASANEVASALVGFLNTLFERFISLTGGLSVTIFHAASAEAAAAGLAFFDSRAWLVVGVALITYGILGLMSGLRALSRDLRWFADPKSSRRAVLRMIAEL